MDSPNLEFYSNKIPFEPEGDLIENILSNWYGDYKKLEENCAYIQWLFPNKLAGKNPAASALTAEEAEIIREDAVMKERVKKAFKIMLDFFGMELNEHDNFLLTENSDERLERINVLGSDAFLHITRILLAIKELGHEHLMMPWMEFLAELIFTEKKLDKAETSFLEFWMETLSPTDFKEMEHKLSTMDN